MGKGCFDGMLPPRPGNGLSLLCFLLFSLPLVSQEEGKGYDYWFRVENLDKDTLYLTYQFQDRVYALDSAGRDSGGSYRFSGTGSLPDGIYSLRDRQGGEYLSLVIDQERRFQYFLDTSRNPLHFRVENSLANAVMLDYQQQIARGWQEWSAYQEKTRHYASSGEPDSAAYYRKALGDLNLRMRDNTYKLIEQHPGMLFAKMQKAMLAVEIPREGRADREAHQHSYYLHHYWDHLDFQDERVFFTPVVYQRVEEYISKYLFPLPSDTIIDLVDDLIGKSAANPTIYYFFIDRLSRDFSYNLLPGHDLVYVHLMEKYRLKEEFIWQSGEEKEAALRMMRRMEPLLRGKRSPELIMADTSGRNFFSTYHTPKKYTVIWFFDPECEVCAVESEKLREVYLEAERQGRRDFEVYAVGIDEDVERWKRYVKEKAFPWINVGGQQANIDYIKAFNVLANPWMIIIDGEKNFVLNRRIDPRQIPAFLRSL